MLGVSRDAAWPSINMQCMHNKNFCPSCVNLFLRSADSHLNEYRKKRGAASLVRWYKIKAQQENGIAIRQG